MSTVKVKIKFGSLEVEYEGEPQFLKEELPDLLEDLLEIYEAGMFLEDDDDDGPSVNGNSLIDDDL